MEKKFWRKSVNSERANAISNRGHSKAYHAFFEGYSEYKETDEKGKVHIWRVYTAPYYGLDAPKAKRRRIKFINSLLFLAAAILFILSGVSSFSTNYMRIANLIQAVSFVFIVLTGKVLLNCLVTDRMTLYEYQMGPTALRKYAKWASAMVGIAAAAMAAGNVYLGVAKTYKGAVLEPLDIQRCLVALAGTVVSATLLFVLYRVERKQTYIMIENENCIMDPSIGRFILRRPIFHKTEREDTNLLFLLPIPA